MKTDVPKTTRPTRPCRPQHRFAAAAKASLARLGLALATACTVLTPPPAAAESGWGANYTLAIAPGYSLPDYHKRLLAGDADSQRFGNAFAVGDFNEDGRPDLVVHLHGPDPTDRRWAARVYLQDNQGNLSEGRDYNLPSVGEWTFGATAADFNEDGHLDVIMDDVGNDLLMMSGKGDGTFWEPTLLGLGASGFFAVADVNADKHLDLMAGKLDGTVGVFVGAGNGTFTLKATLATQVIPYLPPRGRIMTGDLDADGKLDLAVASVPDLGTDIGNLDVFLGNGDGTFQDVKRTANAAVLGGVLGDFDGNGLLDFAGTGARSSVIELEIWLGNGNGQFAKARVYPTSFTRSWSLGTADLNLDGIADIFVTGEPLGPLNIFLGNGNGSFQARQPFRPLANYQYIVEAPALVDFNGDGRLDLVGLAEDPKSQPEMVLTAAISQGPKTDPQGGVVVKMLIEGLAPADGVLEGSTNLVDWSPLATNATAAVWWRYVDTSASDHPHRFYRARRQ